MGNTIGCIRISLCQQAVNFFAGYRNRELLLATSDLPIDYKCAGHLVDFSSNIRKDSDPGFFP